MTAGSILASVEVQIQSHRMDNFGKWLTEVHMYACEGSEQTLLVQKYCQHPLYCCLVRRFLLFALRSCESGAGGVPLQYCAHL